MIFMTSPIVVAKLQSNCGCLIISFLAGLLGWWFYSKLGVVSIGIPFSGELFVGWLIIPLFILFTNALYASGVIDGIDGLSGGVFTAVFTAYAAIAFGQEQYDLAALISFHCRSNYGVFMV